MPVVLRTPGDAPASGWDRWVSVAGAEASLDPGARLPGLGRRMERIFAAVREEWWALARELQKTPSAELAHAACCNPSPSDLGAMLAWSGLVRELAGEPETTLVLCGDPWLFRHLAEMAGVDAGRRPPLLKRELAMALRGFAARTKAALRVARAAVALKGQRAHHGTGEPVLLVYGHPGSDAEGNDAYFADLMKQWPGLKRLLHTDCGAARARELCADGRTASLHAWGSSWFALTLPFARWRPVAKNWLVRRAAAREGAGGQGAMTRWQSHCQTRWLQAQTPRSVAWPWENQPWERPFVRAARCRTVGYLHTVVGRHMWNQSPNANIDGLAAIPDVILCNGPAYRRDIEGQGMPPARLADGGAFRFSPGPPRAHDPDGPVFVALSSNLSVTAELMAAVMAAAGKGHRFVVKDHPMYPFDFPESDAVARTRDSLYDQPGLKGVLYCASVVGYEAMLSGLPTVRFLPSGTLAVNVLPNGVEAPTAGVEDLAEVLSHLDAPQPMEWTEAFAPVDLDVWRRWLLEDG